MIQLFLTPQNLHKSCKTFQMKKISAYIVVAFGLSMLPTHFSHATPEVSQDDLHEPRTFREQIIIGINDFIETEAARLQASDQGVLNHRISGLDPRLRLGICQSGLQLQTSHPNWLRKRSHLKAHCDTPSWSLMIGLELSLYREVIVARTAVKKNQPLDSVIEFANMDILALHSGYLDSEEDVKGKVAKRNLTMGQIISPHLVKAQVLVPRNGLVEVKAQIGVISVTSQGVALENGAFGDTIKVRNNRSKRVIEARVVRENMVEIML